MEFLLFSLTGTSFWADSGQAYQPSGGAHS